jgi:hypothetical protein
MTIRIRTSGSSDNEERVVNKRAPLTLGKAALDVQIVVVLAHDEMHLAHALQLGLSSERERG